MGGLVTDDADHIGAPPDCEEAAKAPCRQRKPPEGSGGASLSNVIVTRRLGAM